LQLGKADVLLRRAPFSYYFHDHSSSDRIAALPRQTF
jgi:hypothetical protein